MKERFLIKFLFFSIISFFVFLVVFLVVFFFLVVFLVVFFLVVFLVKVCDFLFKRVFPDATLFQTRHMFDVQKTVKFNFQEQPPFHEKRAS